MHNPSQSSLNEIDLLPYFLALWKRKYILIGGLIIGLLLGGILSSFFMQKQYESRFTLIFRGNEEVQVNERRDLVFKPVISGSETIQLLQRYQTLIKENKNNLGLYKNILKIKFPNNNKSLAYPLFIKFNLRSADKFETASADVLSYLRNNEYVYEKVEQRRQFIKSKLFSYKERIKNIEAGSAKIAKTDLTQYSNLQLELIKLKDEEANLAYQLGDLKSYTYVIKPYLLNEGNPTSPNIILVSAIGGFSIFFIIFLFIFVKVGLTEYHKNSVATQLKN